MSGNKAVRLSLSERQSPLDGSWRDCDGGRLRSRFTQWLGASESYREGIERNEESLKINIPLKTIKEEAKVGYRFSFSGTIDR